MSERSSAAAYHPPHKAGAWILDTGGAWHASVEFDGYEHGLACGHILKAPEQVAEVRIDPRDLEEVDVCEHCRKELERRDA